MNVTNDKNHDLDAAIRAIMEKAASVVGEEFPRVMVLEMARHLGAYCTLIGVVEGRQGERIRSLAVCIDGEIQEPLTYDLAGTPCDKVVDEAAVCCIPRNVTEQFPEDILLQDLGAVAYVGIPLLNSRREVTGNMVAVFQDPVIDREYVTALMLVFSARTSAEVERLRMEEERRELEQQLLHAQKLESLGLLAGGIAHDFNNILCGILGSAELALATLGREHPVGSDLAAIVDTSQQAASLCHQLLVYAGKAPCVIRPVNLTELCRRMRPLLEVSTGHGPGMKWELDESLPAVEGDAAQLQQVVLNLVVNAVEASRAANHAVVLRTGCRIFEGDELESPYMETPSSSGRHVFLEVVDRGCGMDEQTLRRLFDPFYSTKFSGRGLGLAAVVGIVRQHRGCIQVESELGVGTTMRVILPSSPREEDISPGGRASLSRPRVGRALIVDGFSPSHRVLASLLAGEGYAAEMVGTQDEAVKALRASSDAFDLILLDAGLGGQTFLKQLYEQCGDARIVIMEGSPAGSRSRVSDRLRADARLRKPISAGRLRALLRELRSGPWKNCSHEADSSWY